MSTSREIHLPLFGYLSRSILHMQNILRGPFQPFTHLFPVSISQLLIQIEEATTPSQLTRIVNKLQSCLWKLPPQEQALQRKRLDHALSRKVLEAPNAELRIEAAGWLRLLVQAGLIRYPEDTFVTLVTATVRTHTADISHERRAYLKMIFDCFWPFRYPYPAFGWQLFPDNAVFYPLAPLLSTTEESIQEIILAIFAELPSLDDAEIVQSVLPMALRWLDKSDDPELRRKMAILLSHMSCSEAKEALSRLECDADPLIRACARRAAENIQQV